MNQITPQTIHLATDHAGLAHKNTIRDWLISEGFSVVDHGAREEDPLDDYPDFIAKAAAAVSAAAASHVAIIFGGSGQGEAMMANRFPNVRAGVYYGGTDEIIRLTRQHNDANVLSIGARFVSVDDAKRVVWDWLHTVTLEDEKYTRRNHKIETYTREFYARDH